MCAGVCESPLTNTETKSLSRLFHLSALVAIGAASHHALDVALLTATAESYAAFFSISTYRLQTLNLYLSSDRWPEIVAGTFAVVLWGVRRYGPDTWLNPAK